VSDPRPSRPSAAVVLLRGHGDALETYWVKRSDAVRYMPGFRAFPGGTANTEDAELEVDGLEPGPERIARACAIREAFEETGVLLADRPNAADLETPRTRLLEGAARFPDLAREHGWRFRADAVIPAGRWISPAFAATRFETQFFVARLPEGQEPTVRVGELAEGEWVHPIAALARWYAGHETFAAPILYSMIALGEGEEGAAERMAHWPDASGLPVRRIELKWGIVLQPMKTRPLPPATHSNAYLVGDREMALIDPGSGDPDELRALFELIDLLGQDGRAVKLVLLTHHHPDHIGGLDAVRERLRVPVGAHPETATRVRVDFSIDDGQWITLVPQDNAADWSLRAIHTPGHARGHLCFYHPRTRSLFSGDHVVGGAGTVIVDPPEGDMSDYIASLERLSALGAETLFPGHGSPQGAVARRLAELIAHRRGREEKVLAALEPEPRTLAELVERVYADTPRELWPYAERSLLAHLIKLEREGRAARAGEKWRAGAEPPLSPRRGA
jgi:glyoxylase-like metal-dependent hydrolase (beta-lactamase superfamily II)/8-oxo-dGTP pyrophosphatase MutT (NUDIX family)